jgi:hypothetical protein
MNQSAIIESQLSIVQQKPIWERLPNESAKWHMRFRRYLALGPKRSVNQVFVQEQQERTVKSRGKVGSTWYNAVKRFEWERRAEAYDREQDNQKAAMLRQIAMKCAFVSRPFRIVQLNSAATTLMREMEKGQPSPVFLAMLKELRELMSCINDEVESWNVPITAECDAAALGAFEQKILRQKELEQDLQDIEEENLDFQIAMLEKNGSLDRYREKVPLSPELKEEITRVSHANISRSYNQK